ncbi:MAG: NfeD family protein [Mesorhizobium sp.]|jgi:membrane protein implicated in regulation of membrane protease activity|uniref:NfeD family protein n=1 Tax=unclassified Mesorhizobium TaxID=325217 RepID=UPI000FE9F140|nr:MULTISPECIES: NfeD family protein [unclassified Mesorhizobium]RWI13342.1 MAG: NfeD family protein [Mesorhizobium sp.]RWK31638.1 MAG: NfeD family protein [Mesorhizobium sp.]RWK45409.1 MAG: NfeD family protein [Mesorhizobium sp.]RWK62680.1 MAG: NfeD family protein [Mesorhizobium sp.]RWK79780.1 MAG: NfeD family protein [Mesorhizobium sp.]
MFERIISELGPWVWMVLGFVLLVMEVIAPGIFMLWIGIAALLIGVVSLLIWDADFWTWQIQVLAFLAMSLVSTYVGKRLAGGRHDPTDQPLLNRRGEQMIGRMATLAEPIKDGRGRIKLGDTLWRVSGPDLPAGTQVRVTGAADTDLELTVEAVLD